MRFAHTGGACLTALVLIIGACSSDGPEDPEAFCDALRDAAAINLATPLDLDDPVSVADAIAELDQLVDLSPDELEDDVTVVAEVYGEILNAVAATAPGARNDVLRDLQPRLDEVSDPAARLQAYGSGTCAVTFDAPAQPTPTPTPLDIDN